MPVLLRFCLFFFITSFSFAVSAQTLVRGRVEDKNGKSVKDQKIQVVQGVDTLSIRTNEEGNFEVRLQPGQAFFTVAMSEDTDFKKLVTVSLNSPQDILPFKLDYSDIGEIRINGRGQENGIDPLAVIDVQKLVGNSFEKYITLTQAATSNNELTSNYNVRGGNYDENLVYVNGFLINRPFLTRSGQQEGLSFINTALVQNVYFSAGGFQAVYGDKLSSVLDIRYKRPETFHASASASLLGIETHIEDAVGRAGRFRYLIGGRYRANGYLLNSLPTKGNYNPVFWDAQIATEYDINEKWKWNILAHTSSNSYRFAPQTQKTDFGTASEAFSFNIYFDGQEDTRFLTSTVGTSFTYTEKRLEATTYFTGFQSNERESFDIQGQYFINELETDPSKEEFGDSIAVLGIGTFLNHARNRLNATIFSVYHDAIYTFKPNNPLTVKQLKYGFGVQFDDFKDVLSEWRYLDSAGYSVPQGTGDKVELFETIKGNLSLQNQRYHAYSQYHAEWRKPQSEVAVEARVKRKVNGLTVRDSIVRDTLAVSSSRFQFEFGVRALYTSFNDELMITPRASLSYTPIRYAFKNGKFVRRAMKLRVATGLYYQPPFYREFRTFDGTLNQNVKAQKSFHFVTGADYSFYMWGRETPFKVTAEAYYKYLWDVNPYEVENVRTRYYADNIATGYATGFDFNLNGEFVPGVLSFFKFGLLSTKENIKDDFYWNYYNASGERIIKGISTDQVAVDSTKVLPGGIRRPTDQHLNIGVLFQDNMPGFERFSVQMGLTYGSRLPYGPPDYTRYKDTLTIKSYFRVELGLSDDLLYNKKKIKGKWYGSLQDAIVSFEVFNLLGINNVLSKQWIQDVSGKYYSIPNYLTQRRFNLKLIVRF